MQAYAIDAYAMYAASASAAYAFPMNLAWFGFPLLALYMYGRLGYGWGNSVLAFVALGIRVSAPVLLCWIGLGVRRRAAGDGKGRLYLWLYALQHRDRVFIGLVWQPWLHRVKEHDKKYWLKHLMLNCI